VRKGDAMRRGFLRAGDGEEECFTEKALDDIGGGKKPEELRMPISRCAFEDHRCAGSSGRRGKTDGLRCQDDIGFDEGFQSGNWRVS